MRTARLDHNPNAGITFITLSSAVSQPMHTRTGEVPEPQVPKIDADWKRLLTALEMKLHSIANVAREIGAERTMVGKWARGQRQPSAQYHGAIVLAYRKWVGPNVPGWRDEVKTSTEASAKGLFRNGSDEGARR